MALARKTLGIRQNPNEDQRRDQIKEAATRAFSEKPYDRTTLDDIARESGFSKSILYWYWESKGALLSELIDTCFTPYFALLEDTLASEAPYLEKMHQLMWDYFELARENEKLDRLVHLCGLHQSKKPQENFAARVNDHYDRLLSLIEALLRQGMESGILGRHLDASAFALSILNFIEGHNYMSILKPRMSLDRLMSPLYQALLASHDPHANQ